jgi:pyruvate/2-oxoglutarate/acetoin dehydrogenase E1 component
MPSVLSSLNTALNRLLEDDPRVVLLGEDLLDPYGGAFKVTRGLSTRYPDRVLTTPISEGGIVGLATGMALRGLRPVAEIMFGDFVTLAADPLINHAAKFRGMYNGQVSVPLVVRTPMGGRRGYGPTHSQSLEKLFLGIPGLRVLAPCALGDPGELLYQVVREGQDPTLFIENKLLYLATVLSPADLPDFEVTAGGSQATPTYTLSIRGAPTPVLTLAAYGYTAELARQAMQRLAFEAEIFTELVIPTCLAPFENEAVLASVQNTGRLLVIEEGSREFGWGAEILAICAEKMGERLRRADRLGAANIPIPASLPLENAALPGVDDILRMVKRMV